MAAFGVDPPRREVSQQLLQSRPIHRRAREPAVIISRAQADPAFLPLALDKGLAGFALRLQRIEFLLEPLLGRFAGVDRTADGSVPPGCGCWLFHAASALGCTRSLVDAKEPGTRPMGPGNPLGDHGQRAIALAVIFELVLTDEDGMGVSAPPPHQARAGLQHAARVERTSASLELSRQDP